MSVESLVLVANRLPLAWSPNDGWTRSPGGLVTAVEPVARRTGMTWIGRAGDDVPPTLPSLPGCRLASPAVGVEGLGADTLCNRTLWPALHGIEPAIAWSEPWWDDYQASNRAFADVVVEHAPDGATVWIHDYHLLLLPGLLRERRPDLELAFSFHTPIDVDTVGALRRADELLAGVAGADRVGVQTVDDECALRELFDLARITDRPEIRVSPASIDVADMAALRDDRVTRLLSTREATITGNRRLIVGIDRLDYTKGVVERFDAFDLAFRRGWLEPDDVRIVQVAQPTRQRHAEYRDLRVRAERAAHALRVRWRRSDGSSPFNIEFESADRRRVAALLSLADIAVVAPHRDGMNLVAKEFSILNEERQGVLVLGQGAGAWHELGPGSISVSSATPEAVADGLLRALHLPAVERARMARRRADAVRSWTATDWAAAFVGPQGGVSGPSTTAIAPP